MDNKKSEYVNAEVELIHFYDKDIITTSNSDKNEDDDGWTAV